MSASLVITSLILTAPAALAQQRSQKVPKTFSVVPVTVTSVAVESGQLVAHGLMGTQPFSSVLTMAAQTPAAGGCPILNLHLNEIAVSLLGLNVNTSEICLAVTAVPGALLGDLLCNVASQLAGGTSLARVLGSLTSGQLTQLLNALTAILDGAFDAIVANDAALDASCSILSLSVGPVELNLLGLLVELDNCHNGPVTVDITATPGGGLLGDLLCSLTDLLNNRAAPNAIQTVLFQISRVIGQLLG